MTSRSVIDVRNINFPQEGFFDLAQRGSFRFHRSEITSGATPRSQGRPIWFNRWCIRRLFRFWMVFGAPNAELGPRPLAEIEDRVVSRSRSSVAHTSRPYIPGLLAPEATRPRFRLSSSPHPSWFAKEGDHLRGDRAAIFQAQNPSYPVKDRTHLVTLL